MTFFRKPQDDRPEYDGPSLEVVLDHYGIKRFYRTQHMTNCPLHEDKTPSLSVHYEKQAWRCHSCGEAGGPLHIISKMEGVDLGSARDTAAALGIPAGDDRGGSQQLRGSAYGGGRRVAGAKRDRSSDRKYVPSWKRH